MSDQDEQDEAETPSKRFLKGVSSLEDAKDKLDQLLPSIIEEEVTLNDFPSLQQDHAESQVLKDNIELYNTKLRIVHALWAKASSFTKAIQLLREMDALIQQRCALMGTAYGARQVNPTKGDVVVPID